MVLVLGVLVLGPSLSDLLSRGPIACMSCILIRGCATVRPGGGVPPLPHGGGGGGGLVELLEELPSSQSR